MIIASDYDKTLTNLSSRVEQKSVDCIHNFRANGGKFGIVSGRSIFDLQQCCKKFNIEYDFLVGNNGAMAVDNNDQIISAHLLDSQSLRPLVEYIKKTCTSYCVTDGYKNAFKGPMALIMNLRLLKYGKYTIDELVDQGNIVSVVVSGIKGKYKETLRDELTKNYPVNCFKNWVCLDIVSNQVNKAKGVELISAYYHDSDVITIGDGENDVPMIQQFNGYTVKNGCEEAKSVAKMVVNDFADLFNHLSE